MCLQVSRRLLILVTILGLTLITLLFFLQTISVQAESSGQILSPLKYITIKQTFAPLAIGDIFTPTWIIQTVDSSGDVGQYASLALDNSDSPHISYYDASNSDLKYAMWNGSSWNIQTVDSSGGLFTSLALDSSDAPHINYSYYNGLNYELKYASWNGGSWDVQTVDSGWVGSLALDSSNAPHISYTNGDLKYASWNGVSWDVQTVDSGVIFRNSLDLDSSNAPHISYYDEANGNLKYASWNGVSWDVQTVDSGGDVGNFSSLALDSSNAPHIGYNSASIDELKYAEWNGVTWDVQTIDSLGSSGLCTSLALDSSNTAHISHYKAPTIAYVKENGVSWISQTVDSVGLGDCATSLTLDSNNAPHISYFDYSNRDLKYAWLGVVTAVISPSGGILNLPNLGTISFSGNAFSETVEVTYTPLEDLPGLPDIGVYLDLDAVYASNGQPASIEPGQSFTMTLNYSNVPTGLDERTLIVVNWMEKLHQAAGGIDLPPGWGAETTFVDTEANTVTAVVNHFGVFSVFGEYTTFLPITIKSSP